MAGSHTGDRKLGRQCMELVACKKHSGGLRSSLVAFGQSRLVYGQVWSTVNVGHEAEVAVLVLGTGKD